MTKAEVTLIDIKFNLDMYSAGVDTAENTLEKVREILKPVVSLTDNQRTVLEVLKVDQDGWDPFFTIWRIMENEEISDIPTKEQYQVLAAFAEWGLSHAEE